MNVDMDPGSTWNVNTLSNENECQQVWDCNWMQGYVLVFVYIMDNLDCTSY